MFTPSILLQIIPKQDTLRYINKFSNICPMFKKLYTLLFISLSLAASAQDGTRVYEFLNLSNSARQAALGGYDVTTWDADPNNALANPALMNTEMHGQFAVNYVSHIADVKNATFSGVYQLSDYDFIAVNGQYVDYGDLVGTDEVGAITGNFKAQDAAITIGYAREIADYWSIGANLKYINSTIETYKSSAVAADVGVSYHDFDKNVRIGLVFKNIGKQIQSYNQKEEDLPFQVNLGIAHQLEHVPLELNLTLHDLQKFDISQSYNKTGQEVGKGRKIADHLAVGAELFPGRDFNLRLGYNFKRGNELAVDGIRSFSGLTYGFGIRMNAFRIEYGHSNFHTSGGANHFSLLINLDRLIQGRDYWRSNPWR